MQAELHRPCSGVRNRHRSFSMLCGRSASLLKIASPRNRARRGETVPADTSPTIRSGLARRVKKQSKLRALQRLEQSLRHAPELRVAPPPLANTPEPRAVRASINVEEAGNHGICVSVITCGLQRETGGRTAATEKARQGRVLRRREGTVVPKPWYRAGSDPRRDLSRIRWRANLRTGNSR